MAAVKIGALLGHGRPQGALRFPADQIDRNPAANAAAAKVKLARKAQADRWLEVDGDGCQRSSNMRLSVRKVPPSFRHPPMRRRAGRWTGAGSTKVPAS